MIELGKWKCSVNHFLYTGYVYLDFFKTKNDYDVTFSLDNGLPFPAYKIIKIKEQDNILTITAKVTNILGEVIIKLIFDEHTFEGDVSIPILGNIQVVNGVWLQETYAKT